MKKKITKEKSIPIINFKLYLILKKKKKLNIFILSYI